MTRDAREANRISRLRKKIHLATLEGRETDPEVAGWRDEVSRYEARVGSSARRDRDGREAVAGSHHGGSAPGTPLAPGPLPIAETEPDARRIEVPYAIPPPLAGTAGEPGEGGPPPPDTADSDPSTNPPPPSVAAASSGQGAPQVGVSGKAIAGLYRGMLVALDREAGELGCLVRIPIELQDALCLMLESELATVGNIVSSRQAIVGLPALVFAQNKGTKWIRARRAAKDEQKRTPQAGDPVASYGDRRDGGGAQAIAGEAPAQVDGAEQAHAANLDEIIARAAGGAPTPGIGSKADR